LRYWRPSAPPGLTPILTLLVVLLPSRSPFTPPSRYVPVAALVLLVAGRDPHGAPVRRASPAASLPDVPLAAPVPTAVNPDVPPGGRGRSVLSDDRWRALADDDVLWLRLRHVYRSSVEATRQAQDCDAGRHPHHCLKDLHSQFSFVGLCLTHVSPCGRRCGTATTAGHPPSVSILELHERSQRSQPRPTICEWTRPSCATWSLPAIPPARVRSHGSGAAYRFCSRCRLCHRPVYDLATLQALGGAATSRNATPCVLLAVESSTLTMLFVKIVRCTPVS
jgi:hypothetical protein